MQTMPWWLGLVFLIGTQTLVADDVEKLVFIVFDEGDVVASNTRLGRFDRLELHAREKVLEYKVANAVAVVATSQRYVAYGVFTGGWHSKRREAGEKFVSVEAADYSALVITTERFLNFYGKTGSWQETSR